MEEVLSLQPSQEEAASFKAILCTPNTFGKVFSPAIHWAQSSKKLAPLLPQHNDEIVRTMSLPLLLWGVHQPWAKSIAIRDVLDYWWKSLALSKTTQGKAYAQIWATHIVHACIMVPTAPSDIANKLCREWMHKCNNQQALWQWQFVLPDAQIQMQAAWIEMADIAKEDQLNILGTFKTLAEGFNTNMIWIFKAMPMPLQSALIHQILESNLPDYKKINLCKYASFSSWIDKNVHNALRAVLPQNDFECCLQLPLTPSIANRAFKEAIPCNQYLMKMYCPSFFPALDVMLGEEQWNNRNTIMRAVQHLNSKNLAVGALSLPEALNIEISDIY